MEKTLDKVKVEVISTNQLLEKKVHGQDELRKEIGRLNQEMGRSQLCAEEYKIQN